MGRHSMSRSRRPLIAAAGLAAVAAVAVPGTAFAGGGVAAPKPAPAPSTHGCYDIAVCVDTVDLDVVDLLDLAN